MRTERIHTNTRDSEGMAGENPATAAYGLALTAPPGVDHA